MSDSNYELRARKVKSNIEKTTLGEVQNIL